MYLIDLTCLANGIRKRFPAMILPKVTAYAKKCRSTKPETFKLGFLSKNVLKASDDPLLIHRINYYFNDSFLQTPICNFINCPTPWRNDT